MERIYKYLILMLGLVSLTSCEKEPQGVKCGDRLYDVYELGLAFTDGSGNDLVAEGNFDSWNTEGFKLDISIRDQVAYNNAEDSLRLKPGDIPGQRGEYTAQASVMKLSNGKIVQLSEPDGVRYFLGEVGIIRGLVDFQDKITYKVICNKIFGDEKPHVIVTYWGENPCRVIKDYCSYYECLKVEFEGKTYAPIYVEEQCGYVVVLTVER